MSVSTTAYLARRAAQKERVQIPYRRALRDTLNWAVHRHLFYQDVHFPNLNISFRSHSNSALTYVINTKFFFINPGFEPPREVRRQKACGSFSLFSEIFVLITKAVLVSLQSEYAVSMSLQEDQDAIDRMIAEGEAQYNKWRHPDPYIGKIIRCSDLLLILFLFCILILGFIGE